MQRSLLSWNPGRALLVLLGGLTALLAAMASPAPAKAHVVEAEHELRIRLQPAQHRLVAEDLLTLTLEREREVHLLLTPRAEVDQVSCAGKPLEFRRERDHLVVSLPAGPGGTPLSGRLELLVRYAAVLDDPYPDNPVVFDNPGFGVSATISPAGTFLLAGSLWYPLPPCERQGFRLSVSAPHGYYAVTSGLTQSHREQGSESISSFFVQPTTAGLALAAGPYVIGRDEDGPVPVYTYFYKDNADLSARYLAASRRHLAEFSMLLGAYAFPKFAVVENFFPTGFGFPAFTLLGSQVLRLPFIPETSLRHEIAHCWWGNGVLVDPSQGNWSEGLTTYVADYLAEEHKSAMAGEAYRRQVLRDYKELAAAEDLPLARFLGRTSPASRAVGYGKAMFVFHMLRQRMGDERFWAALRQVYADRRFRETGWSDFKDAFVAQGLDRGYAERFFDQWLQRAGAPVLRLSEASASRSGQSWVVRLKLSQSGQPYLLDVPLRVVTEEGEVRRTVELDEPEAIVSMACPGRPLRLEADPESQVFHLLDDSEIPPTVNSIRGSRSLVAVMGASKDPALLPMVRLLLASLSQPDAPVLREDELTPQRLAGHDVLFFGYPSTRAGQEASAQVQRTSLAMLEQLSRSDALAVAGAEVSFTVYRDPHDAKRAMAFVATKPGISDSSLEDALRKITHYGKYSYLAFAAGQNSVKGTWEPESSPLAIPLEVGP